MASMKRKSFEDDLAESVAALRKLPPRDPQSEVEQGCHCWERWYGEWRGGGPVVTCPFHGLPFEALLAGTSPEEVNKMRPKFKPV